MGWFDRNPASMYSEPPTAAEPELVRMAGVARQSRPRPKSWRKQAILCKRCARAGAVLVDPKSTPALEAKLDALKVLHARSRNLIEGAWLTTAIRNTNQELAREMTERKLRSSIEPPPRPCAGRPARQQSSRFRG